MRKVIFCFMFCSIIIFTSCNPDEVPAELKKLELSTGGEVDDLAEPDEDD